MGVDKYKARGRTFWKVDFRVRDPNGRERRIIKRKIPNRELARALEAKILAEVFEGKYFENRKNSSDTVKQIWELYEPITRRDNDSWQSDVGRSKHLLRHLANRKVDSLGLQDIEDYRLKRSTEKSARTHKPPSVTLMNHEVRLLKRIINYAVRCGRLRANPIAHVKLLAESNIRHVVIDEPQFARLLDSADQALRLIVLLAFDCGMRKQEILSLKWAKVDLKEGVIRLAAEDTKTDQARVIYLTERVITELKAKPRSLSGYVNVNPRTNAPWVDIRTVFKRACKKAGIPYGMKDGIIFHDLRRSFVTNARKRGIPESVVMRMSGHKTRTVFDRYNVVDEEDLKTAIKMMDRAQSFELKAENQ